MKKLRRVGLWFLAVWLVVGALICALQLAYAALVFLMTPVPLILPFAFGCVVAWVALAISSDNRRSRRIAEEMERRRVEGVGVGLPWCDLRKK